MMAASETTLPWTADVRAARRGDQNAFAALVKSVQAIAAGEKLTMTFADGRAEAVATSGDISGRAQRLRTRSRAVPDPGRQGSLF